MDDRLGGGRDLRGRGEQLRGGDGETRGRKAVGYCFLEEGRTREDAALKRVEGERGGDGFRSIYPGRREKTLTPGGVSGRKGGGKSAKAVSGSPF